MSQERYHRVAVFLHWVIGLSIILMIALGLVMEDIKPISLRIDAYGFHKSLGITILFLSLFRVYWRLTHPAPALPAGMKSWEVLASKATHIAFYALIIIMPLSGWLLVSASGKYPTIFFWLFEMPHLPVTGQKALGKQAYEIHELTTQWIAIPLIALHVLAALKHHFINRDTVLTRMLPRFIAVKLGR
ncbi:MAG: cytochrome b [Alphaproteobacteria bacterium]|nr:cytochrome b [Alphaproteobacteria bacterium]